VDANVVLGCAVFCYRGRQRHGLGGCCRHSPIVVRPIARALSGSEAWGRDCPHWPRTLPFRVFLRALIASVGPVDLGPAVKRHRAVARDEPLR
jgi:hypothetical protein